MKKSGKKVIPLNYFWLSIEGTDAVGKTMLLEEIEKFLRNQKKIKFIVIKEFSSSSLGNLIKNIINKKKFFSLGDRLHHPFAETLLLCADFVYQFEQVLLKNTGRKKLFIISDRGLYSFLTYQSLRIKYQYQASIRVNPEGWIRDIFKPINKPHFVILLTSPISQIKQRIIERDGSINEQELRFIKKAQGEYRKILKGNRQPFIILENRNGEFENVKQKAVQKIEEILKKEPLHFIKCKG
jgi:thymidylate kinase